MKGLYIHIPFCRKICNYCDFYKMVVSDNYKENFINYLLIDLKETIKKYDIKNVDTIYIGGGTPSCLPLNLLEKLFITLLESFELKKLEEFTIEVNSEDLSNDLISLLKKYFISRISIGVQTFNKKHFDILGRYTDYDNLKKQINLLKENNIDNYSFDLIYALPNQKEEDLKEDLKLILSLEPKHISTYSLILEEKTILSHLVNVNNIPLISEDVDAIMYDDIRKILSENGFVQYETSNFSKPGYHSKHNLIYWNCDEYYGVGPASASFVKNVRFTKVSNMKKYYEMIENEIEPVLEYDNLDFNDLVEDFIMLGLRKNKGINLNDFYEKFQISIFSKYPKIQNMIEEGTLIYSNNSLSINPKYSYIANHIIVKILYE